MSKSIPPAKSRPMTKKQLSRHQQEQRKLRIVLGVAVTLFAAIVLILLFGFWKEFVRIADEPLITVGSKSITARDLSKMIGYSNSYNQDRLLERNDFIATNQAAQDETVLNLVAAASYQMQQINSRLSQTETESLDRMIMAELLHNEAKAQTVALDQAQKDQALVSLFDLGLEKLAAQLKGDVELETPTDATPSADELAAASAAKARVLDGGRILSEADFNYYVLEPHALEQQFKADVAAGVPTTGEQVHARHILISDEQKANEVLADIRAGKLDFGEAAKQFSEDTANKDKGGDLGWFPKGQMDTAFETAAFAMEPNTISDVINSSFGYHIIEVLEHATDRQLEPATLESLRNSAYWKWLGDLQQKEENKIGYSYTEQKVRWAKDNAPKPPVPAATAAPK